MPAAQRVAARKAERARTVVRLPAYEAVSQMLGATSGGAVTTH